MPAGETAAPGRVPLLLSLDPLLGKLPQGKVGEVAFSLDVVDSAFPFPAEIEMRELDEETFRTVEELGIDLQRPERGSDEEDAARAAARAARI